MCGCACVWAGRAWSKGRPGSYMGTELSFSTLPSRTSTNTLSPAPKPPTHPHPHPHPRPRPYTHTLHPYTPAAPPLACQHHNAPPNAPNAPSPACVCPRAACGRHCGIDERPVGVDCHVPGSQATDKEPLEPPNNCRAACPLHHAIALVSVSRCIKPANSGKRA